MAADAVYHFWRGVLTPSCFAFAQIHRRGRAFWRVAMAMAEAYRGAFGCARSAGCSHCANVRIWGDTGPAPRALAWMETANQAQGPTFGDEVICAAPLCFQRQAAARLTVSLIGRPRSRTGVVDRVNERDSRHAARTRASSLHVHSSVCSRGRRKSGVVAVY